MGSEVEVLVNHLKAKHVSGEMSGVVVHEGSADDTIEQLVAEGWTWDTGETEYVSGKRIRYLRPPEPGLFDQKTKAVMDEGP